MSVDPVSLAITAALTAANMALTASQKIEGPRLKDTDINTAEYGTPLNYFYGTRRFDSCPCIWAEPLRENKTRNKTKGGKYTEYKYFGTWAVAVADVEVDAVTRIWFDRHIVYDVTNTGGPITPFDFGAPVTDFFTIYLGTEDQLPDPRIEATVDVEHGAGSTPAYRGVCYIVFKDVPLENVGNRLPQVTVEATRNAADLLPFDDIEITLQTGGGWVAIDGGLAFSASVDGWSVVDLVTHEMITTGAYPSGSWNGVGYNGTFYGIDDGAAGPAIITVDPISGATGTLYEVDLAALAAGGHNTLYIEQNEWLIALPEDPAEPGADFTLIGTRTNGYAYDMVGALGGSTINAYDFHADPVANSATVSSFVRDYDSGLIYGLFIGAGGRLIPTLAGGFPLASADGILPPPEMVDVPTRYFGVGLSSGKWLIAATGATDYLALFDPVAETWEAVAEAPGGLELGPVVHAISPESFKHWIGDTEYDLRDLSVIRSIIFPPGTIGVDVYDPINHAIVGSQLGGAFGWTYLDRVTAGGVTLQTVFDDVSGRVGLVPGVDTESDPLAAVNVRGYSWTQGQARDIVEPLFDLHDFDLRPHGFGLEAVLRGGAAGAEIEVAYMGAGNGRAAGTRYSVEATLDSDLPLKVSLSFADEEIDQQTNTALAQRVAAATDSDAELAIDLSTYVLIPDEAKPLTERYLRRKWIGSQKITTSLGRRHIGLEPADVRILDLDGVSKRARLLRMVVAGDGTIETEWERDGAAVATLSTSPGAPADGVDEEVIPALTLSNGFVLDIPLVTDSHEESTPQLYIGAAPVGTGGIWPGATTYISADAGATYDEVLATRSSSQRASWGVATTALASASAEIWDRGNSVNVELKSGTLSSTTEAAINASGTANLALLGDELIQFATATLEVDGTYTLTDLKRGRRGTEWAIGTHAIGEEFILIDSALGRASMGASDVGQAEYFKTFTDGRSAGSTDSFTFTGATLKPYAPAHLEAELDAGTGDWTLSWIRRTRVGGAWTSGTSIPLSEASEEYEVEILDGGTVVRTITGLATPEATYTAADQTTDFGAPITSIDFRVYQMSDAVGRGYAATGSA